MNSNENLLRQGECPWPNCLEPAGHAGSHCLPEEFIAGIRRGVAAFREGKVAPWEEVERELGISQEEPA